LALKSRDRLLHREFANFFLKFDDQDVEVFWQLLSQRGVPGSSKKEVCPPARYSLTPENPVRCKEQGPNRTSASRCSFVPYPLCFPNSYPGCSSSISSM